MTIEGKTVLITGANTGIGLEAAAALAGAGAHVVLTTRDASKGDAAVAEIKRRHPQANVGAMLLDLSRFDDVRRFVRDFAERSGRLDVLVNNAGAILDHRMTTVDGNEMTFQVNHLGPFLLTNLLLPTLKSSTPSRVVNVASTAHRGGKLNFDDLEGRHGYRGMQIYGTTKLCNILFTRELARRLDATGVTANSLHPGTVRTGFGQDGDVTGLLKIGIAIARPFMMSPAKGARTTVYVASSPDIEGVSGEYFARSRRSKPSSAATDDSAARRLWDVSEKLVGL